MTTLTQAHKEWANRSADERFGSLQAMHAKATEMRTQARVAKIKEDALRVVGHEDQIMLEGPTGSRARLTNWSFGQLAGRAGAPADYIASLPAELAANCLNTGLKARGEDKQAVALM